VCSSDLDMLRMSLPPWPHRRRDAAGLPSGPDL